MNCNKSNTNTSRNNSLIVDCDLDTLAMFFKAFADETRLKIMKVLLHSERCVGDIADELEMSTSAVSHQMRILKTSKLVKSRRDGKNIYYSLDDDHVEDVFKIGAEHISHIENPK